MNSQTFLNQIDRDRIAQAIREAEAKTSAEIRVVIYSQSAVDALPAAWKVFEELGLKATRERNALLVFVAPVSHTFAVIGDEAANARLGEAFWKEVAAELRAEFQYGRFTEGILAAVAHAGDRLAPFFPRRSDDRNELPDSPVET